MQALKQLIVHLLRDTANKIDAGTCELNTTEATELIEVISHIGMSKESACMYLNISRSRFDDVYFSLLTTAKAFTISNTKNHISIVGFNKHFDIFDYLNSIIHESEHIKDAMLYSYNVENYGEPPAYTIAYIATKLIQNSNLLNYIK